MAQCHSRKYKLLFLTLGPTRPLNPDGLNGLFFSKKWEIIKDDVFKAVIYFFIDEVLGDGISFTSLSLIPKILHPESVSHFRPISCCTFLYKVIAAIVLSRLDPIMATVITPQQSAFVSGHMIQDNLVVVHETFHFLKK